VNQEPVPSIPLGQGERDRIVGMVLSRVLVLYGERGLGIYRDPAARKEVAMVSCPSSHPEAKARLCASPHSGGIGPLYMNIHDETREAFTLVRPCACELRSDQEGSQGPSWRQGHQGPHSVSQGRWGCLRSGLDPESLCQRTPRRMP